MIDINMLPSLLQSPLKEITVIVMFIIGAGTAVLGALILIRQYRAERLVKKAADAVIPNSGSSLADAIARIEEAVLIDDDGEPSVFERLDGIEATLAALAAHVIPPPPPPEPRHTSLCWVSRDQKGHVCTCDEGDV